MRTKLKTYALVFCLFIFLFIVLGGGLRLNPGAAFLAATTGTPLLVYAFNRMTSAGPHPRSAPPVAKVCRPELTAELGEQKQ